MSISRCLLALIIAGDDLMLLFKKVSMLAVYSGLHTARPLV